MESRSIKNKQDPSTNRKTQTSGTQTSGDHLLQNTKTNLFGLNTRNPNHRCCSIYVLTTKRSFLEGTFPCAWLSSIRRMDSCSVLLRNRHFPGRKNGRTPSWFSLNASLSHKTFLIVRRIKKDLSMQLKIKTLYPEKFLSVAPPCPAHFPSSFAPQMSKVHRGLVEEKTHVLGPCRCCWARRRGWT